MLARNLHVAWSGWSWRARALDVEAAASSRPLGKNVLRSAADGRDGTLPLSAVAEVQAPAAVLLMALRAAPAFSFVLAASERSCSLSHLGRKRCIKSCTVTALRKFKQ